MHWRALHTNSKEDTFIEHLLEADLYMSSSVILTWLCYCEVGELRFYEVRKFGVGPKHKMGFKYLNQSVLVALWMLQSLRQRDDMCLDPNLEENQRWTFG